MSNECRKRIKLNITSIFPSIVLLIVLMNESRSIVNCSSIGEGVKTVIPKLLQQTAGDLATSETYSIPNIPGLDSVRGFIGRNYQWLTPVAAAVPAKLASYLALRALRQQAVNQEQQTQQQMFNGMRGLGGRPGGERDVNEGGEGFVGDGVANDEEDSETKNSMMVFVGDGNIQVKNHGNKGDDEDDDNEHLTYQEIDESKHLGNFQKKMPNMFDMLKHKHKDEFYMDYHNYGHKKHKESKSKSKSKSKSNHKRKAKNEEKSKKHN